MYFLIYGDDAYRARAALDAARAQFTAKRDASGLNTVTLRAGQDAPDRVAEALFASPFLAEKKLVVLEGYLRSKDADQTAIKDMLAKKPDSTAVIFFENADRKSLAESPLFEGLCAQKFTSEHAALSGTQLERFIADACRGFGVTIEPRAAAALAQAVAGDTWQARLETEKVCAYANATGAKTVTAETVNALVHSGTEDSLFAFLDACIEGRSGQAASLLENLIRSGISEVQIASMLLKQIRTMIAAKDLAERGSRDKGAIAAALGIHPFPAGKALAASRKFTMAQLTARHADLVAIDRRLKTGSAKESALFDLFALKMTA